MQFTVWKGISIAWYMSSMPSTSSSSLHTSSISSIWNKPGQLDEAWIGPCCSGPIMGLFYHESDLKQELAANWKNEKNSLARVEEYLFQQESMW